MNIMQAYKHSLAFLKFMQVHSLYKWYGWSCKEFLHLKSKGIMATSTNLGHAVLQEEVLPTLWQNQ